MIYKRLYTNTSVHQCMCFQIDFVSLDVKNIAQPHRKALHAAELVASGSEVYYSGEGSFEGMDVTNAKTPLGTPARGSRYFVVKSNCFRACLASENGSG